MTKQRDFDRAAAIVGAAVWLTAVSATGAWAQDRPPPSDVGAERGDRDGFDRSPSRSSADEFEPGSFGPGSRDPHGPGEPGKGKRKGKGPPPPHGPGGPDGHDDHGGPPGPRDGGRRPPPAGHMPPHEWERLEAEDPEMYALLVEDARLERQTLEVASRARRATSDERERLRMELAALVGKHFEARQQRRELQLKRMEEEIKRLRQAIETRNDSRDKIVTERIQELVAEVDPLDF